MNREWDASKETIFRDLSKHSTSGNLEITQSCVSSNVKNGRYVTVKEVVEECPVCQELFAINSLVINVKTRNALLTCDQCNTVTVIESFYRPVQQLVNKNLLN